MKISILHHVGQSTIAKTTLHTTSIFILRLLLQSASIFIIAGILGAQQFSIYAAVTAIAVLLGSIANLGFNTLVVNELGRKSQSKNSLLSYAIPTIFIVSLLSLPIFFAATTLIGGDDVGMFAILAVGITEVVVMPLFILMPAILYSESKIIFSQIVGTAPIFLRLLVALILYFSLDKITANILLEAHIAIGMVCGLLLAILKDDVLAIKKWRIASRSDLNQCFKYSVTNAQSMALGEIDKPLTAATLSSDSAGVYALSTRITGAITLPVNALIISSLNKLISEPSNQRALSVWILFTTSAYSFGAMAFIFFAADALILLFDSSFSGLSATLATICLAIPGINLRIAASNILMAKQKLNYRIFIELAGLTLIIISMLLINPTYQVKGAIYSLVFAEWCMALVGWILILKRNT